ncbi:phosphatidate cytidylyltransferase [Candidatus Magnetominusculus xianensis]|uniref:Phosphatidate cytidylyltransferase n=1 Tax=Candidatus Magnetominusculus xianensis TaxID=1748249 RepID=A0ABR5SI01_9BACT|nr:phosphatidate cytidylyltransferase [Candidatus Magnetominusculus xianensis]KWT91869.1 phosphatidate cytidylyltransferase [Candidatus Magnetominusculus xianensis]MBF0404061.1 phosphatidate cytidylyltransferase [Nitrospirota bacterium]
MLKRLIVAAILLPLLYAYIMYLPGNYFLILMFIAAFICMEEFLLMYGVKALYRHAFSAVGLIPLYMTYLFNEIPAYVFAATFMLCTTIRLFDRNGPDNALFDIAPFLTGLFYIPVSLSYFIKLRAIGPEIIMFLMLVIWGADSAALYIGKAIGRRKLYESISPNKTVEGAVAAVIGGAASAVILKLGFKIRMDYMTAAGIGIVLGILGIIGDLIESMFKRERNIKDSGSFLPGHGGMLDKVDGMLIAAPVLYYLILFINKHNG